MAIRWLLRSLAAVLFAIQPMHQAHAYVGGVMLLPAVESGNPADGQLDRIPLSSFSWELPKDVTFSSFNKLSADQQAAKLEELQRAAARRGPLNVGPPGTLIIAKRVAVSAPSLATYCQQKARLKEVVLDTRIWDREEVGRNEHFVKYRLKDVVVEACGHIPDAVAETFHLAYATSELISEGTAN